jgi:hypothetical protein
MTPWQRGKMNLTASLCNERDRDSPHSPHTAVLHGTVACAPHRSTQVPYRYCTRTYARLLANDLHCWGFYSSERHDVWQMTDANHEPPRGVMCWEVKLCSPHVRTSVETPVSTVVPTTYVPIRQRIQYNSRTLGDRIARKSEN